MTAPERTEKLLLEIAERRADVESTRQFTDIDFCQYLATHEINIDVVSARGLLEDMTRRSLFKKLLRPINDPDQRPRFRIAREGANLLLRLEQQAKRETSAQPGANDAIAAEHRERGMVVCVSEKALDRWWRDLCDEMKADVFTTYLESFDDSEAEHA